MTGPQFPIDTWSVEPANDCDWADPRRQRPLVRQPDGTLTYLDGTPYAPPEGAQEAVFDPDKHPRRPRGQRGGGQFAPLGSLADAFDAVVDTPAGPKPASSALADTPEADAELKKQSRAFLEQRVRDLAAAIPDPSAIGAGVPPSKDMIALGHAVKDLADVIDGGKAAKLQADLNECLSKIADLDKQLSKLVVYGDHGKPENAEKRKAVRAARHARVEQKAELVAAVSAAKREALVAALSTVRPMGGDLDARNKDGNVPTAGKLPKLTAAVAEVMPTDWIDGSNAAGGLTVRLGRVKRAYHRRSRHPSARHEHFRDPRPVDDPELPADVREAAAEAVAKLEALGVKEESQADRDAAIAKSQASLDKHRANADALREEALAAGVDPADVDTLLTDYDDGIKPAALIAASLDWNTTPEIAPENLHRGQIVGVTDKFSTRIYLSLGPGKDGEPLVSQIGVKHHDGPPQFNPYPGAAQHLSVPPHKNLVTPLAAAPGGNVLATAGAEPRKPQPGDWLKDDDGNLAVVTQASDGVVNAVGMDGSPRTITDASEIVSIDMQRALDTPDGQYRWERILERLRMEAKHASPEDKEAAAARAKAASGLVDARRAIKRRRHDLHKAQTAPLQGFGVRLSSRGGWQIVHPNGGRDLIKRDYRPIGSRIELDRGSYTPRVYAHEFVHRIQSLNPWYREAERAYQSERIGDEKPVKLSSLHPGAGYRSDEKTSPDQFYDDYMGKRYAEDVGTELGTVAMEALMFPGKRDIFTTDPDTAYWMLGALARL